MMFYAVYIAVCLAGMLSADCDKHTAVHWVVAPERQASLTDCFRFGLFYISQTALIVPGKTYPKVFCQSMQSPD
jgi:hypothetical protein